MSKITPEILETLRNAKPLFWRVKIVKPDFDAPMHFEVIDPLDNVACGFTDHPLTFDSPAAALRFIEGQYFP